MLEVLPGSGGRAPRYRLHELIRLFGQNKLTEAGGAGGAALRHWRRRLVAHWTRWLAEKNSAFRVEDSSGLLRSFDAERHNVEATLALAENAVPRYFPPLLAAGRHLLRHRMDNGTRQHLFTKALAQRGAADGELSALLLLELGFVLGGSAARPCARPRGAHAHVPTFGSPVAAAGVSYVSLPKYVYRRTWHVFHEARLFFRCFVLRVRSRGRESHAMQFTSGLAGER